jgi:hypothetical protein
VVIFTQAFGSLVAGFVIAAMHWGSLLLICLLPIVALVAALLWERSAMIKHPLNLTLHIAVCNTRNDRILVYPLDSISISVSMATKIPTRTFRTPTFDTPIGDTRIF